MSWMEERKFEWIPLAQDFTQRLLGGISVVIVTDEKRKWLSDYICKTLNKLEKNRPFLPMISFENFSHLLQDFTQSEDYDLLLDMLNIAFKREFIFWYIGKTSQKAYKLIKKKEDSFLWVMDEEVQNSFFLRSNDELIETKLISLVRLLDKTIDAVLFREIVE